MTNRRSFLKLIGKSALALPLVPFLRLPDEFLSLPNEEEFQISVIEVPEGEFCDFVSFDEDGYTINWTNASVID